MRKRYSGMAVLVTAFFLAQATEGLAQNAPTTKSVPQAHDPLRNADIVHGTIDVVVATREGFVLASDSRATHLNQTHSDDAQKLFTVGKDTACVVAGLIQTGVGDHDFHVLDSIAAHLRRMDQVLSSPDSAPVNAFLVSREFESSFRGMVGLLERRPDGIIPGSAGAVSVVSIDTAGKPQWISFYVPIQIIDDNATRGYLVTTGQPVLLYRPMELGLRFDVGVIGQPEIAWTMLQSDNPGTDEFSRSPIMRKYYSLKKRGALDSLNLEDGVELAKTLVAATEELAPTSAGVGGPIDVATVTAQGVKWVQRKTAVAPPPLFRIRMEDSRISRAMAIDGLECIRCTIADGTVLLYSGEFDAQFIDPVFEGRCSLSVSPEASRSYPQTVRNLVKLVRDHCNVSGANQVNPSAAPQ